MNTKLLQVGADIHVQITLAVSAQEQQQQLRVTSDTNFQLGLE
jgi:hypothetical protein